MDASEYETNTLLIKGISSIVFRIYEPSPEQHQAFRSAALELESSLRGDGHLVTYDTGRQALWHFSLQAKDGQVDHAQDLGPVMFAGSKLILAEEGTIEALGLHKNRFQPQSTSQTPINTASASSLTFDSAQRSAIPSPVPSSFQSSQDPDGKAIFGDLNETPVQSRVAYEYFILAFMLTTSTAFCSATGAIPLNYRTVLLSGSVAQIHGKHEMPDDMVATLGTFGAYLTTTGTLALSLNVSQCKGMVSLNNLLTASLTTPEQKVLAAPFGVQLLASRGIHGEHGSASLAQTPNTQVVSFRGITGICSPRWKDACLKILKYRGVVSSALEDCSWLTVSMSLRRLHDRKQNAKSPRDATAPATLSWPRPLCFRKRNVETTRTSRSGDNLLIRHDESHEPLGDASQWLLSSVDREEQISKRKAERTATHALDPVIASSRADQTPEQSLLIPSRTNMATAGAMYPTPPDGVQQPNDLVMTFDGAVSSPGNLMPPVVTSDMENSTQMDMSVGDVFDDGWESNGGLRRDRSDSNFLGETENMVMGGVTFDENDITEDDFSFFDDQPGGRDLQMGNTHNVTMDYLHRPAQQVTKQEPTADGVILSVSTPVADVFTKPELKHARSLIGEEQARRSGGDKTRTDHKRETSPFTPDTVFRRVQSSIPRKRERAAFHNQPFKRKESTFGKVELGPILSLIDQKYEKGGIFDFDEQVNQQDAELDGPLETGYLKRQCKRHLRIREQGPQGNALMRKYTALELGTSQMSPMKGAGSVSDDDGSSVVSDRGRSSPGSENPGSPMRFSIRGTDDDAVSHVTSFKDFEGGEEFNQQVAIELPGMSKPESPEISLWKFFSDPEPLASDLYLSDENLVQVAQIVTEQAATGSVDFCRPLANEAASLQNDARQDQVADAQRSVAALQDLLPGVLKGFVPVRLKGLLEVSDVPLFGQPTRLQPRAIPGRDPNAEQLRPNSFYPIPVHHLEVRRSETKLSILPSAVSFWESLGLAPVAGSKQIKALCVFPSWTGMTDNVTSFLSRMKSVYELLRLGTFERISLGNGLEEGAVPYEVDRISTSPDASVTGHGSALMEAIESVQDAVMNMDGADLNIVFFMVYSPANPSSIIEACLAFQRFFDMYRKSLASRRETPQNELCLQLISAEFISTPTALVMLNTTDLTKLCLQTYDRCASFEKPMPAPAIVLEQSLPRMIDFKLTGNPSASLIHENSCIHVAYAQSIDERWVSAAWTDDGGRQQSTTSYCLGRKGRGLSNTIREIAHEIWDSTIDLIAVRKVHWRIIVTKSGPIDSHEVECWTDLARSETKANVALLLMTVETNPSLQLLPPTVHLPPSTMTFYTTPASTPQPGIVSPEQTAAPATPLPSAAIAATPGNENGNESEADAALLDLTDQTWGAVLGHRLNCSSTLLELRPALASAYLVKRTSARLEDPPVAMEVNLVHTEGIVRAYEPLLREMLSHFRGLGTLARARGVVEKEADVRPWHVAAAEKAVRTLYMLM